MPPVRSLALAGLQRISRVPKATPTATPSATPSATLDVHSFISGSAGPYVAWAAPVEALPRGPAGRRRHTRGPDPGPLGVNSFFVDCRV